MIGIFFGYVIHLDGGGGAAALGQARLRGGEGGDLLGWRAGHAEYSTVQYSTYSTVQYSTDAPLDPCISRISVMHSTNCSPTVQYSTVQYSTVQ